MYEYRVVSVDRVVDGDTVDVTIDVGFRMTTQQRIRLVDIDAPERGQAAWGDAKLYAQGWCDDRAGRLRIRTFKTDSFGRYLGDLFEVGTGAGLSAAMLASGHATRYAR